MTSFDSELRELVEKWRERMTDNAIIDDLEAEIESLKDALESPLGRR